MACIVFDLWQTLGTKRMSVMHTLFQQLQIPVDDGSFVRYEASVQLQEWPSLEDMAENFLRVFDRRTTPQNVRFVIATFERAISQAELFPGRASVLTRLRAQGHRLGVLSNTTVFESEALSRWDPIGDWFEQRVFSWQTGVLKPNLRAFRAILDAFDAEAADVVYVDDSRTNVQAARAFGFRTIQFSNVIGCSERLLDIGYLPP